MQKDVEAILKVRRVPVIIGALSDAIKSPDDVVQQVTLQTQFNALRARPDVQGINYCRATLIPSFTSP